MGKDLIQELLKSFYRTRRVPQNCEKTWQRVLIDSGFVIGTWSPAIVCCRERELCGFVHGGDFIITGDSMQLAIESRLNDKWRAIPGPARSQVLPQGCPEFGHPHSRSRTCTVVTHRLHSCSTAFAHPCTRSSRSLFGWLSRPSLRSRARRSRQLATLLRQSRPSSRQRGSHVRNGRHGPPRRQQTEQNWLIRRPRKPSGGFNRSQKTRTGRGLPNPTKSCALGTKCGLGGGCECKRECELEQLGTKCGLGGGCECKRECELEQL